MIDKLSLMPGTMIQGHYIVQALLNEGGFGSVYRAIDTGESNRPCALKETYDITPAARRRALTEVAILSTIHSPHLPQVYEAFEYQGRFYLVMELIEGRNLLDLSKMRGHPFTEQDILRWLLPVMDVLQELHSRTPAVIHRDIKPNNIILTPDERAVLVDFGLTRLYDPASTTHTMVRAVSEGFSPAEQYVGKTTPQSDIYSMAATIYFLLTMTVPQGAMERVMHDELIPPHVLNAQVSPHTEAVLLKALAVNASQRFASMHEFAAAFHQSFPVSYPSVFDPGLAQAAGAPTERVILPGLAASAPATPPFNFQPARPYSPAQVPPAPVPSGQVMRPPDGNGRGAGAPSYPVLPSRPRSTPPPQTPVANRPRSKSPASAYNQGCLWGLAQGICAALLVLSMKNSADSNVLLAVVAGFFFYFLAGLLTTRRGGSSLRGIWAGFWSGIFSAIVFWAAFLVGLVVQMIQLYQQNQTLDVATYMGARFQQVVYALANQQTTQQFGNAGLRSIFTYLITGLVIAMSLGLGGGLVGSMWARRRGLY